MSGGAIGRCFVRNVRIHVRMRNGDFVYSKLVDNISYSTVLIFVHYLNSLNQRLYSSYKI